MPHHHLYNCAAYAIDIYDNWYNAGATVDDAKAFMTATGSYQGRSGTVYSNSDTSTWAKAVYYNGVHFAKIAAWNGNGAPISVRSKWGGPV